MLTYEGCFGEKGFEEHCEIEWERKTIEGNVCIRPLGSGDKWFEEVEEQFGWPGRPALLPDGRLCVPDRRHAGRGHLQIVVPTEEIKCFPYSVKMLKAQGRWAGDEKEWPSENLLARLEGKEIQGADAAGRRAIRASRVCQPLKNPACVVASPQGAVFVLEDDGTDYSRGPEGQTVVETYPAVAKKFSWSDGKMELKRSAEGLELGVHKKDLALGASVLYVLDGLKVHVLDLENLKSAREPIGLKECAPHAVAVVAVGSEIFVADGCEYCVEEPRPRGGSSVRFENAPTRVVVLSGAGELKRTMPLPTGHRYSGFQSLTALPSDKLLAVTRMELVSMTTQGEILQVLKLPACMDLPYGGSDTWSNLYAACADEQKVYVIAGEESGECRGGTIYHRVHVLALDSK